VSEPTTPPADSKDWTWVLDRTCPECGFTSGLVFPSSYGKSTRRYAEVLVDAVRAPGAAQRPSPDVWSVLEYACHVRDVCRIFGDRLGLMLDQDDPLFANWDQDETALSARYWTQDPSTVAGELDTAAAVVAARWDAVLPAQLPRTGRRSNGSVFTVESLGRYFLHDLAHHAWDVGG
jgi:hypothetical protein